ncbi:hypothetical protein, partial [Desulfovibrio sp. DV]|uniref:hypothetical protein n=1 Tax=Desulfovibrio sp. DV TaxID=1844708 RepID=UPI001C37BF31
AETTIAALTTTEIEALNATQIDAFTTTQLAAMTPEQLAAIESAGPRGDLPMEKVARATQRTRRSSRKAVFRHRHARTQEAPCPMMFCLRP